MQGGDLHDLQYCWDCNILVVFPTLGLNFAKIIDYIEKCFKQKVVQKEISCKKTQWKQIFIYPRSGG